MPSAKHEPSRPSDSPSLTRWERERLALEVELGEPITVDGLTGAWSIFQRKRGHRHSSDDVLTAYYALELSSKVTTHLDLGTGIGTVGLLVLWGMGETAKLTCVEAQTVSERLLRANIAGNDLTARVDPHLGDLRDLALPERFPLVTGSPPYFPPSSGVVPRDSQKAHARFELRGDVSDYARAAKRHLAPGGIFVFCFPTVQRKRAELAVATAGFRVERVRDVVPRASLPPLFSLFGCRLAEGGGEGSPVLVDDVPLTVRHEDGALTEEMARVRRRFGFE